MLLTMELVATTEPLLSYTNIMGFCMRLTPHTVHVMDLKANGLPKKQTGEL